MIRFWVGGWRKLSLSVRMGAFVFMTFIAAMLVGEHVALPGWVPWVLAASAAVAAAHWVHPLEEVVEAAHAMIAGDEPGLLQDRNEGELRLLARAVRDITAQLDASREQLEERNLELEHANEWLEQLSITDGLTRLHNHRHFQDRYQSEARRSVRTGHPLCLILIDIDDFKRLNDQYGHSAGDRVLAAAARVMENQVRETDYIARYGGEEFAVLLPETTLEGAEALAEKLRLAVGSTPMELGPGGASTRVTISLGAAAFDGDASRTFDAADRALYAAKDAGKDCVILACTDDPVI